MADPLSELAALIAQHDASDLIQSPETKQAILDLQRLRWLAGCGHA